MLQYMLEVAGASPGVIFSFTYDPDQGTISPCVHHNQDTEACLGIHRDSVMAAAAAP